MPGTTPLGLRYPLPWETVTAQSFQDLSEDIDAALDALDLIRTQARVPEQASVIQGGAGNALTQAVTTTLTYTIELYDTGGLSNLGVNNDRLTLSAGLWFCNGWAISSGGTTTTGSQLQLQVATVMTAFHRVDNSSFTGKNMNVQALLKIPVDGTILQLAGVWFGTGGPQTWSARLQVWKVREL
jgi:hypothetical protein